MGCNRLPPKGGLKTAHSTASLEEPANEPVDEPLRPLIFVRVADQIDPVRTHEPVPNSHGSLFPGAELGPEKHMCRSHPFASPPRVRLGRLLSLFSDVHDIEDLLSQPEEVVCNLGESVE